MVTAEYFPSQLNAEANWQSRSCKEPSEYKLCPKVFQQIYQWRETPQLDLFVSRHSQQPSQDNSQCKIEPFRKGTGSFH